MSDHADTIRRQLPEYDAEIDVVRRAHEALDALLAERQQAIDALRRIANVEDVSWEVAGEIADAALVNLGETE